METSNISSTEVGKIDIVRAIRQILYWELPQWGWLQWVITLITGCPYEGQKAMFRKSSGFAFGLALSMLVGGYTLSGLGISLGWQGIWLIPIGWAFVTGGGRALQTSIMHACIHAQFTGNRKADMLIGDAISVILCITNAVAYFHSHCGIHHSPSKVATVEDDDLIFLLAFGFKPGMTKKQLWNNYWKTLISPYFHWVFLQTRFKSNFINAKPWRIVASVIWWVAVLALIYFTSTWLWFLLGGVFPLTIIYHCSAISQFLSEHLWLYNTDNHGLVEHLTKKEQMLRSKVISPARFFGEAPPVQGANAGQWVVWTFRMLFIHLPLRVAVIPTPDLVWHPIHHSKSNSDWRNVDFQSLEWVKNKPDEYIPIWGLSNAIDLVFDTMSQKEPLEVNLSEVNMEEVMLGM